MDILITVDTEFSSAGYFNFPERNKPVTLDAIYCTVGGRSEGLGFLLKTFRHYGLKATFFVESAHTLMLGTEPMKPIIDAILGAGHDVQMHIHPMWLAAEGARRPILPAVDSFGSFDEGTCKYLIEAGLEAFDMWGAPSPRAFRAGNLDMGRASYRALRACGIPVSSSVAVAINPPDDPEMWIENGRCVIEGVVEVPVLAFADFVVGGVRHLRNLTIAGAGIGETIAVLKSSSRLHLDEAVVLAHPFDFIKKTDGSYSTLRVNRINRRRLEALCEYVVSAPEVFDAVTFSQKIDAWIVKGSAGGSMLKVRTAAALARAISNKLNDYVWRL